MDLLKGFCNLVSSSKNYVSEKVSSACKAVVSTTKSFCTNVKNKCKKAETYIKEKWEKTPRWGKVAIGAVAGAGLGVAAVCLGPAALAATAAASVATIGTTATVGGIIGYFLHSEKVKENDDPERIQPRQEEKKIKRKKNKEKHDSQSQRDERHYKREQIEETQSDEAPSETRRRRAVEFSLPDQQGNRDQQRNPNENRNGNFEDDIQTAIAMSLSIQEQNDERTLHQGLVEPLVEEQRETIVHQDDDLSRAIELSLADQQRNQDQQRNPNENRNGNFDDDIQTAIAMSLSIQEQNDERTLHRGLVESLVQVQHESIALENNSKGLAKNEITDIELQKALDESIILYLEKCQVEAAIDLSLQELIMETQQEVENTLQGLDGEYQAMELLQEALNEIQLGKIDQQFERITQALRHFSNAGERLDTAASIKRLNIILQTAKTVIESLIQIEAFDEVVEFCEKMKQRFPEYTDTFNRIEQDLETHDWIGNVDDIANRELDRNHNIVHLANI